MKKLYVGCRVRILWSRHWPHLNGKEGVISAVWKGGTYDGLPTDWEVTPKGSSSAWIDVPSPIDGLMGWFCPSSKQLEPIQPEGMQPASWADCLWSPESGFRHDKVTA